MTLVAARSHDLINSSDGRLIRSRIDSDEHRGSPYLGEPQPSNFFTLSEDFFSVPQIADMHDLLRLSCLSLDKPYPIHIEPERDLASALQP